MHRPDIVSDDADDAADALARGETTKFVVAPHDLSLDEWDRMCKAAWDHGNVHIINDESKGLYAGQHIPEATEHHQRIMMQGRVRGVGVTNTSQRPRSIPKETITECEHVFCFRLNTYDDRKIVAEVMGDPVMDAGRLGKHEFYYWNTDLMEPVHCAPL